MDIQWIYTQQDRHLWILISTDIHVNLWIMGMDVDAKFHINGKRQT